MPTAAPPRPRQRTWVRSLAVAAFIVAVLDRTGAATEAVAVVNAIAPASPSAMARRLLQFVICGLRDWRRQGHRQLPCARKTGPSAPGAGWTKNSGKTIFVPTVPGSDGGT